MQYHKIQNFILKTFLPNRVDRDLRVDISLQLWHIHIRDMLEVSWQTVILADQWFEDAGEVDVGVLVAGVDAAVLVVELNGAGDGLGKGEAGGLGHDVLQERKE